MIEEERTGREYRRQVGQGRRLARAGRTDQRDTAGLMLVEKALDLLFQQSHRTALERANTRTDRGESRFDHLSDRMTMPRHDDAKQIAIVLGVAWRGCPR